MVSLFGSMKDEHSEDFLFIKTYKMHGAYACIISTVYLLSFLSSVAVLQLCMCYRELQSFNWTWKCKLYILTVDMFMSRKAFLSACSLQLLSRVSCAIIYDISCPRVAKIEHIHILVRAETSLHLLPQKDSIQMTFWICFADLKQEGPIDKAQPFIMTPLVDRI